MTDRQIAALLGRTLESVRSQCQRLAGVRWASPFERWSGSEGHAFEDELAQKYQAGASQSILASDYHVEWSKLRQLLRSRGVSIRNKSQQAFIERHGRLPRIVTGLSNSKLYIIFAMFGDNLRPTSQTKRATHIIGIAAGKDRDFAEKWVSDFEREYLVKPTLRIADKNNIQASISSVDIWNDLHQYAIFGTRSWRFHYSTFKCLMTGKVSLATMAYGLAGFFDAEGSVKHEVKRASRQVTAASINMNGLKQISDILNRIGIGHRLYEGSIAIFGRNNLISFQRKVGFAIVRKNEALINMISTFRSK